MSEYGIVLDNFKSEAAEFILRRFRELAPFRFRRNGKSRLAGRNIEAIGG